MPLPLLLPLPLLCTTAPSVPLLLLASQACCERLLVGMCHGTQVSSDDS